MAHVVSPVTHIAHRTHSAIVLIHHVGTSVEKFFRGATSIQNKVDALASLRKSPDDDQVRIVAFRKGGKMRYAPKPEDHYLRFPHDWSNVGLFDATEKPTRTTAVDNYEAKVIAVLPAKDKTDACRRAATAAGVHGDNKSVRDAWDKLVAESRIDKRNGQWVEAD